MRGEGMGEVARGRGEGRGDERERGGERRREAAGREEETRGSGEGRGGARERGWERRRELSWFSNILFVPIPVFFPYREVPTPSPQPCLSLPRLVHGMLKTVKYR